MTDMTLQQAIDEVTADRDKFDHPTGVTVISHQAVAVLVNAARAQLELREQLAAMTQRAHAAEGERGALQRDLEAAHAELAELAADRDAWRVRAEHDSAALAAVPVEAIRCLYQRARYAYPYFADLDAVEFVGNWLNAQPQEVQA